MFGGSGVNVGWLDVQSFNIFKKRFHVEIRVLFEGYLLFLAALDGFVIDVRQVHDMSDIEASVYKPTLQQILKEKSPEISNMCIIVNGGAASVHFHFTRFQRLKNFFFAWQSVKKTNAWLIIGHNKHK